MHAWTSGLQPSRKPVDLVYVDPNGADESWDILQSRIKITFTETAEIQDAPVNGWLIFDAKDLMPDFAAIKIVKKKTTADWDDTMIAWDKNSILINYTREGVGIDVEEGQTLTLRVVFDPTSGSNRRDEIVGTDGRDVLNGKRRADDIDGKGA